MARYAVPFTSGFRVIKGRRTYGSKRKLCGGMTRKAFVDGLVVNKYSVRPFETGSALGGEVTVGALAISTIF